MRRVRSRGAPECACQQCGGDADLALFQWWLKALAGAGTLADRYRTFDEMPTARVDKLPVIAPPDRRLPRIAKGVQWLKTHQRESGRWFTRSLRSDGKNFLTHAGTAFALLALHDCGEGR